MKLSVCVFLLTVMSVVSGFRFDLFKKDDATTSSKQLTTVWVTLTTNGRVTTQSSLYSQTFMSTYTTAASVPQGSIGVGSQSGNVGGQRSYQHSTINGAATIYGGIFGWACIVLGYLL